MKNNHTNFAKIPVEDWNGILLVGEFPYKEDISTGYAFRSSQGLQLRKLLAEVGIKFSECAVAHALDYVPPHINGDSEVLTKAAAKKQAHVYHYDQIITLDASFSFYNLDNFIVAYKDRIKFIFSFGKMGLLALHGETNIDGYRGSQLEYSGIPYIPTHSMGRLNTQWKLKNLIGRDLKRAVDHDFKWNFPETNYITNPDYDTVIGYLDNLYQAACGGAHIAADIETRWARHISYIGFAWSKTDAICIPIIKPVGEGLYWTDDELMEIVWRIKLILECDSIRISGQNYHYDAMFLARNWGIRSHIWCDTMVSFHAMFAADIDKNLAMLASLFCDDYVYWKDESEGHEPTVEGELKYQEYNCKDCCYTWEIAESIMSEGGLRDDNRRAWQFQSDMWNPLFNIMMQGTAIDMTRRRQVYDDTRNKIKAVVDLIKFLTEDVYSPAPRVFPENTKSKKTIADKKKYEEKYSGWWGSPAKVAEFFFDVVGVEAVTVWDRATKKYKITADDDALGVVQKREPVVAVVAELISSYRSLCKFLDAAKGRVSNDGRMRSGYKLARTSTYRLASGIDCFDEGLNLQNISKGNG